jgi:hypothetical protein
MDTVDFLLAAPQPWVVYRTLVDLLDQPEHDAAVQAARQALLGHPLVRTLLTDIAQWPGQVLNSHKSAGQLYHKLAFAAELGLTAADRPLREVAAQVVRHPSPEGLPQLPMTVSQAHGGAGREIWAWALCDAPLLLYSLALLGLAEELELKTPIAYLTGLVRDNGWPCAVADSLHFRGPGRRQDPCPYATLIMLKLLSILPNGASSAAAEQGVASLLDLWQYSREKHPYIFYMGTDFRKLKAPFIWYDLLHVAEVLSRYASARQDTRLAEMLAVIHKKADPEGFYTPESVWTAWRDWDFAQKKQISPWLTFLVARIDRRCGISGTTSTG